MPFKDIQTIKNLSDLSQLSEKDINEFINNKSKYIKILDIKKRSGGKRKIYSIQSTKYKKLIEFIYDKLYWISSFEDYVQGFVKKKGIITNAKKHLNKKIIINADIKNFFESITVKQIINALERLWLKNELIDIIINITTYKWKLPTWFSTSPIISNLVCYDLDKDLYNFANENNYIYSRYSDDITLSTCKNKNIIKKEEITQILEKHGFKLNEKKFRLQKKGWNLYVTWLTVCDENKPRIPRHIKRKLRQEAYYINKYWFDNHMDRIKQDSLFTFSLNSIKWWIDYIKPLEIKLANYVKNMTKKELGF